MAAPVAELALTTTRSGDTHRRNRQHIMVIPVELAIHSQRSITKTDAKQPLLRVARIANHDSLRRRVHICQDLADLRNVAFVFFVLGHRG